MALRGRRINNFVDFSSKACSGGVGIWLLTQRPQQPLKERVPNTYHRKIGFLMINPSKRDCQGGWGQENHSVSKALEFFAFLRSKKLLRSQRLLRSSWLMEPMRSFLLRLSDSFRNLNSIIWWLESSYFEVLII
jgi:hypothetical protein